MVDAVVDGLDHHDDDWRIIGPPVEMEDPAQLALVHLLRECDQRFPRPLRASPQLVEVWKLREVLKWRGRNFPSHNVRAYPSSEANMCIRVSRTLPNVPFVVASSWASDNCAHSYTETRRE